MRCYLEGIITPTNVNQKKKKMPLPKVKCHIKKFYMYERKRNMYQKNIKKFYT